MNKVTVVWNKHGEGRIVGVFDDPAKIEQIKKMVAERKEATYITFLSMKMNEYSEQDLFYTEPGE